MDTTEPRPSDTSGDGDRTIERRGLIAAAWAAVLGLVLKHTTQPVQALASQQFQDVATVNIAQNAALGATAIHAGAGYASTLPIFTGLATNASVPGGLAGGISSVFWAPSMRCGVHGYYTASAPAAGVLGEDHQATGAGVLGRSGSTGLGPGVGVQGEAGGGIGVRGVISSGVATNGIGVYGVNNSQYDGPGPGAGGFGVYGLSARGHGLVGATSAAGAAAVVGATNGVQGAYAAAFYGPVAVSGALTVFGAKSAAVPHPDGSHRLLYCVESPDSWFEDFGTGTLECGRADVRIDPEFAAVADLANYHVFLTPYDIDFPLSVKMRTTTGFAVRANPALARAAGVSENDLSGTFSWRIVAKRKDIDAKRLAPVTIPPEPERPNLPVMRAE